MLIALCVRALAWLKERRKNSCFGCLQLCYLVVVGGQCCWSCWLGQCSKRTEKHFKVHNTGSKLSYHRIIANTSIGAQAAILFLYHRDSLTMLSLFITHRYFICIVFHFLVFTGAHEQKCQTQHRKPKHAPGSDLA